MRTATYRRRPKPGPPGSASSASAAGPPWPSRGRRRRPTDRGQRQPGVGTHRAHPAQQHELEADAVGPSRQPGPPRAEPPQDEHEPSDAQRQQQGEGAGREGERADDPDEGRGEGAQCHAAQGTRGARGGPGPPSRSRSCSFTEGVGRFGPARRPLAVADRQLSRLPDPLRVRPHGPACDPSRPEQVAGPPPFESPGSCCFPAHCRDETYGRFVPRGAAVKRPLTCANSRTCRSGSPSGQPEFPTVSRFSACRDSRVTPVLRVGRGGAPRRCRWPSSRRPGRPACGPRRGSRRWPRLGPRPAPWNSITRERVPTLTSSALISRTSPARTGARNWTSE